MSLCDIPPDMIIGRYRDKTRVDEISDIIKDVLQPYIDDTYFKSMVGRENGYRNEFDCVDSRGDLFYITVEKAPDRVWQSLLTQHEEAWYRRFA